MQLKKNIKFYLKIIININLLISNIKLIFMNIVNMSKKYLKPLLKPLLSKLSNIPQDVIKITVDIIDKIFNLLYKYGFMYKQENK